MIFLNYLTPRRTQQNIMVSKNGTTTFLKKEERVEEAFRLPQSSM